MNEYQLLCLSKKIKNKLQLNPIVAIKLLISKDNSIYKPLQSLNN